MVHHLDLTVELPDAPGPDAGALAHVRGVFDALLGVSAPADWPTTDYVLAATGRTPVPAPYADRLGPAAERFPLLG